MVQELNLVVVLFPEGTPVTFRRLLGGGLGWEENSARVFGQLSLKFLLPFMHLTFSDHFALLFSPSFLSSRTRKMRVGGDIGASAACSLLSLLIFLVIVEQILIISS